MLRGGRRGTWRCSSRLRPPRQQAFEQLLTVLQPYTASAAGESPAAGGAAHIARALRRADQPLLDLLRAAAAAAPAQVAQRAGLRARAGARRVLPHYLHCIGVLAHRKLHAGRGRGRELWVDDVVQAY